MYTAYSRVAKHGLNVQLVSTGSNVNLASVRVSCNV